MVTNMPFLQKLVLLQQKILVMKISYTLQNCLNLFSSLVEIAYQLYLCFQNLLIFSQMRYRKLLTIINQYLDSCNKNATYTSSDSCGSFCKQLTILQQWWECLKKKEQRFYYIGWKVNFCCKERNAWHLDWNKW